MINMPKKRLCTKCSKRRSLEVFPKGQRVCNICKDTKRIAEKKEHKEELKTTWIKRLDKLVGSIVRSRKDCESPRPHICSKAFQWCHGISRSYHNTRWLIENGFKMCNAEHYYYTNHPLEWEEFLISQWGEKKYKEMRMLALDHSKNIDYKALYESLKSDIVK